MRYQCLRYQELTVLHAKVKVTDSDRAPDKRGYQG